jgi:hypothetical protein
VDNIVAPNIYLSKVFGNKELRKISGLGEIRQQMIREIYVRVFIILNRIQYCLDD